MKLHHLVFGAMQPFGGALFDGRTPVLGPANLICHGLLLETAAGPVLVDTGTVSTDPAASAARLNPLFRITDRVRLDPAEAPANQVRRLGHDPAEVRHIVMTHLDFDHVGGLPDFPGAQVHVAAAEREATQRARSPKEIARYQTINAMPDLRWRHYPAFTADFFGLPAAPIDGVPALSLVWLPGHTPGHCGVAVELGGGRFLLHAGDAIFNAREFDPNHPSTPTAGRFYQWFMQSSQADRRASLAQLRRLRRDHAGQVQIICTHDPALMPPSAAEPLRNAA